MRYLSVCSGIEAATQAWHPLGWTPVAFSEIEKFPSAVLAHHYPSTPNWGDMTKFKEWPDAEVDVLVGGTPCQSFSVAGLRKGLDDPRGNLALTYLAIAERYRPEWLVWENVPGVLSSDGGRAFGAIIGGMVELGYCPAWRVLDAQYVRTRRFRRAVPQRRRRVFVVAHLGDWQRAAAVLFDRESLRGNPPPGREAGEEVAGSIAACSFTGGAGGRPEGAAAGHFIPESAHALTRRYDSSEDGCGRGTPLVPTVANPLTHRMHKGINTTCDEGQTPIPVAFHNRQDPDTSGDVTHPLGSMDNGMGVMVAAGFKRGQGDKAGSLGYQPGVSPTLTGVDSGTQNPPGIHAGMAVRRLTPVECERLQGFPDDFTRIPWRGKDAENCPDGPRYKALGNSMACNAMEWIGRRIQMVSKVGDERV